MNSLLLLNFYYFPFIFDWEQKSNQPTVHSLVVTSHILSFAAFLFYHRYKESFMKLKAMKAEIDHLHHLLDRTRVQMQRDFDIWWSQQSTRPPSGKMRSKKSQCCLILLLIFLIHIADPRVLRGKFSMLMEIGPQICLCLRPLLKHKKLGKPHRILHKDTLNLRLNHPTGYQLKGLNYQYKLALSLPRIILDYQHLLSDSR